MKKIILALLLSSLIPAVAFSQMNTAYKEVKRMLKEKDYFSAREFMQSNMSKITAKEKLVLDAYIGHAFNRPAASNKAISSFWRSYLKGASDSLQLDLLKLQQNNHGRLFEYAEAFKVSTQILTRYKKLLSQADSADIANTAVIWKSLIGSPRQQISIAENTVIKMKRDEAKLANIEVKSNGVSMDFIFDTGANFSTVTETTARTFNMKILNGSVEVGAVTGAKVLSGLAICPVFSMGDITVRNAVFLVLPDSALSFPQIKYQINGIIGFPVIEALKEVQITRDDKFIVPKVLTASESRNMALEFLTPIYQINDEYYTFDTGANGTMLYNKYLKKHEHEILSQYTPVELKFGGAGGMVAKKGYKITYRPTIANKTLALENVEVFSEGFDEDKDHFYGNIGQDVIKQFDKMIINFSDMFIRFE